jgi:hypothetical protein
MIEFKDGPMAGQRDNADVVNGRILVRLVPEQRSHLYRLEAPDQAVFILTERTEWLERLLRVN